MHGQDLTFSAEKDSAIRGVHTGPGATAHPPRADFSAAVDSTLLTARIELHCLCCKAVSDAVHGHDTSSGAQQLEADLS